LRQKKKEMPIMAHPIDYPKRIIIALDVETRDQALALLRELKDTRIFKVGLELFTSTGPVLLEEIRSLGKDVFLDLKLHDIPNTVAEAIKAGVRLGAAMMTIHASGGEDMMVRAAEAAREESEKRRAAKPLLLGVTVLTSLRNKELRSIGMASDTAAQVLRLAALAKKAGLDGVVCSAEEIEFVRKETGERFLLVTPGIRPAWAAAQDQKRVTTPLAAFRKGSDYLVIGRPVTRAASPADAFRKIVAELEADRDAPDDKKRTQD
jgi:orotidine-5'-phosphate decarboxylase